ncbi:MAG TPA: hypothetical protein VNX88_02450 [Terriglobales bacterium]|jgi:hypothetical protein|nr:hypothetical protein [Terriglobales bacterium]
MLFDQHQPGPASEGEEVNLLPPPELNVSLLRSLFANLRDLVSPKRLPPLKLSSRPVDVGMLVGDILDVPWYRTILSNIGDAISPDTRPPLQLESHPVDVELISDQPAWWRSLLRNLADTVAPERQPALRLTSGPVNPQMASEVLITPRWSSLIETPKVFLRDPWRAPLDRPEPLNRPMPVAAPIRTILVQLPSLDPPVAHDFDEFERKLVVQLQRSIRRTHIREFVWLSVIVAEVIALVALQLMQH